MTSQSSEASIPTVVQKYGGSSVASSAAIKRVAERIVNTHKAGKRVVVVVSAMASTTDELLARAGEISESPSRRELDMLLSCGERASMALLAMAVHELGAHAVSLTGSQSGIMTNDRHSGARIIEVRPIRVLDELERGNIVIVAGFQGVSYKREITTLGRGGSDTTAVALAGALEAEYCEICSDVDGVYSADPRLVEGAQLLAAIDADEMLELAAHGAKVLHAGCVEIAKEKDIKLYARATAKKGGGTLVAALDKPNRSAPVGVCSMKALVRIGFKLNSDLLSFIAEHKMQVLNWVGSAELSEIWVCLADQPDWPKIRQKLEAMECELTEDLAMVSLVGSGIGQDGRNLAKFQQALIGSEIFGYRSSPMRLSAFCSHGQADKLVSDLHELFLEEE